MKRIISALLACAMSVSLVACASSPSSPSSEGSVATSPTTESVTSELSVVDCPVIEDTDFGGVYIDMTIDEFNARGFSYGDSLNVSFSNGYELTNLPYYNGYYTRMGEALVVAYPGYPHVKVCINNGDPLWEVSGVSEGDTATLTLAETGSFSTVQEALGVAYTNDWNDYKDDVMFANFRTLSGGNIKEGAVYRSASPVDNEYNRVPYVEKLMAEAGVAYILNLSDNNDEIDTFLAEDAEAGIDMSCFLALRDAGCIGAIDLGSNFASAGFASKLAAGLADMAAHEGPYLVHCVEGKDRTGFVCILLEALAGASYEEMQADYMKTYDNYYFISKESDPERYQAISDLRFDEMMAYLAGADVDTDLSTIDYTQPARDYLTNAGMTEEQVDALVARITL